MTGISLDSVTLSFTGQQPGVLTADSASHLICISQRSTLKTAMLAYTLQRHSCLA